MLDIYEAACDLAYEQESNRIKEGESLTDSLKPNSTIEIGGRMYDTDDNGNIFKVDGYELLPNKEYVIDGVNGLSIGVTALISV